MDIPPFLEKVLNALGISPTWLRWRLREFERNRADGKFKPGLPIWLRWVKYEHKFCPQCRALVHGRDAVCPSCGARLPTTQFYKVMRALGLLAPEWTMATMGAFLAVIILVFAASVVVGGPSAIMRPSYPLLLRFGMLWTEQMDMFWRGDLPPGWATRTEIWRWLTMGVMHIGLIHIAFNGMALVQIGPMLEGELGPKRMLVLITLTQIAAAMAVVYSGTGAAGASGWLFGLIGFSVSYYHRHRSFALRDHCLRWAVYGFAYGFILGAHNFAHAGGAIAGVLLGLTMELSRARRTPAGRVWDFLFYPCLLAWVAAGLFLIRSIAGG